MNGRFVAARFMTRMSVLGPGAARLGSRALACSSVDLQTVDRPFAVKREDIKAVRDCTSILWKALVIQGPYQLRRPSGGGVWLSVYSEIAHPHERVVTRRASKSPDLELYRAIFSDHDALRADPMDKVMIFRHVSCAISISIDITIDVDHLFTRVLLKQQDKADVVSPVTSELLACRFLARKMVFPAQPSPKR